MLSLSSSWFTLNFLMGILTAHNPPSLTLFGHTASLTLDRFIALGVISAFIPPSIYFHRESKRKNAIDNNLPTLLQEIAEAGSVGMTLIRAIEVSTEHNYGPLTRELKKLVAQLSWRVPFDKALQMFAERCDTPLARRTAFMIQAASRTGGDIQESIETIARHIREIQKQERKRMMQMKPYIGVIYISFFVFLITAYFLSTQFFNVSLGIPGLAGMESFGGFGAPIASKEIITPIFFYMTMVEGVFSGLAGGKMSTGSIKNGFLHSTILCTISFTVFSFL